MTATNRNLAELIENGALREDFYYRTETLTELADRHGLDAQLMTDWAETGHPQSKIRVTRRS